MNRRTGALILCISMSVGAEQTDHLVRLSTQLRPIEEAQKMRNSILKGFSREVITSLDFSSYSQYWDGC